MANYKLAIPHILKWEGGWVDDPEDTPTMKGVTIETYRRWCSLKGYPRPTMQRLHDLTQEEWERIFKELYWDAVKGDEIENQNVANMLVDWYWMSGATAVRMTQRLLGVTEDGKAGVKTLAKINAREPKLLFQMMKEARTIHFRNIAKGGKKKFLRGWLNRLYDLRYVPE